METKIAFPYEFFQFNEEQHLELLSKFEGVKDGFVKVGPQKWLMPKYYELEAEKLYNFKCRAEDIWVVTYPRSGTTLTQEMVWLLANNLDFETARKTPLGKRFPFFEVYTTLHPDVIKRATDNICNENTSRLQDVLKPAVEVLEKQNGSRFIKTHLPFSLLPPDLLKTGCKVIYVARNPKDVAVSYYHFHRLLKTFDFKGNFKEFWKYFVNDLVMYSPYWPHLKEGWQTRNEENVLFVFYENLTKNLREGINTVATFLGKSLSKDQLQLMEDHMNLENFKNNQSVNLGTVKTLGLINDNEQDHVRSGKNKGWKDYFDDELTKEANIWIEDNLKTTDMQFPVC